MAQQNDELPESSRGEDDGLTLAMPLHKLAFIIEKAREFDEEVPGGPIELGSNPSDDGESAILFDMPDNPTEAELRAVIFGLNVDELEELLALIWVGRGDFDATQWPEALALARETRSNSEADYLIGTPLLADYLEEGLATLGLSLDADAEEP